MFPAEVRDLSGIANWGSRVLERSIILEALLPCNYCVAPLSANSLLVSFRRFDGGGGLCETNVRQTTKGKPESHSVVTTLCLLKSGREERRGRSAERGGLEVERHGKRNGNRQVKTTHNSGVTPELQSRPAGNYPLIHLVLLSGPGPIAGLAGLGSMQTRKCTSFDGGKDRDCIKFYAR